MHSLMSELISSGNKASSGPVDIQGYGNPRGGAQGTGGPAGGTEVPRP